MLYGHGDDRYKYDVEIKADFSSNIRGDCLPEGLKDYLMEKWEYLVNHYPDPLGDRLQGKIAENLNLSPQQVLPCNGTVEAVYLLAHYFAGSNTAILIPTFSEYEDACLLFDHKLKFISWEETLNTTPDFTKYDVVFICNPNNPTGRLLPKEVLEEWVIQNRQTYFIIDEAYIHFVNRTGSPIELLYSYNNLVILRSLTKTYGLPGLRIGYMFGPECLVKKMVGLKPPWTVNALALEAGSYIFDRKVPLPPVKEILNQSLALQKSIDALPGYACQPSETHYFLCRGYNHEAAQLKKQLLEDHGILIRDASNFRGLSNHHFRISVQNSEENQLLIDALKTIS